jgi:hypothetical protein
MSSDKFTKLLGCFILAGPPLICTYTGYKLLLHFENEKRREYERLLLLEKELKKSKLRILKNLMEDIFHSDFKNCFTF